MARPERFELPTPKFVAWCSIQLSYGRVEAANYMPFLLAVNHYLNYLMIDGGERGIRTLDTQKVCVLSRDVVSATHPSHRTGRTY